MEDQVDIQLVDPAIKQVIEMSPFEDFVDLEDPENAEFQIDRFYISERGHITFVECDKKLTIASENRINARDFSVCGTSIMLQTQPICSKLFSWII